MDAAVIALVSSIAVAAIGGAVAITTTVINSRNEREKAAKVTMDEMRHRELGVKDERIALRDEQLADCKQDVQGLERKVDYYKDRLRELGHG